MVAGVMTFVAYFLHEAAFSSGLSENSAKTRKRNEKKRKRIVYTLKQRTTTEI